MKRDFPRKLKTYSLALGDAQVTLTRRALLCGMAGMGWTMAIRPSYAVQMRNNLDHLTPEQRAEYEAMRARMLAALPYERVTVPGHAALSEWESLKSAGRGLPIVIGGDDDLERIAEQFSLDDPAVFGDSPFAFPIRSPAEILDMAAQLQFPADLSRWPGAYAEEELEAPVGEWPVHAGSELALTVASDILTGEPLDSVHILLIPAKESWRAPAFLRWGNWNACPPAEYHVAALRAWNERYGAELIGLSFDTMNVRSARQPGTQAEAMALAREQYRYCPDIVDQGTNTLTALAIGLIESNWWYFWWD